MLFAIIGKFIGEVSLVGVTESDIRAAVGAARGAIGGGGSASNAEQLMRIGRIGNPQTISLPPRPPKPLDEAVFRAALTLRGG